MKIELITSNGEKHTFEDFGKNGDYITVNYENENGEKLVYLLRATPKGRLVLN